MKPITRKWRGFIRNTFHISCLIIVTTATFAQDTWRIASGAARPVETLPQHIKAPDGKFSLYADYEKARHGEINLYIINKTRQPISIPTQDGDPFIIIEVRMTNDVWRRAQNHVYSDCGNSYSREVLSNGYYFVVQTSFSTNGSLYPVRFRTYDRLTLISNEGAGTVSPWDIEACKYDMMAIHNGDLDLMKEVLLKDVPMPEDAKQLRVAAVNRLGAFKSEDVVPILKSVLEREDTDERLSLNILRLYGNKAPDKLQELILSAIKDVTIKRREWILKRIGIRNSTIYHALLVAVKNPDDPHLHLLLRNLSVYESHAVRKELERIIKDSRYSEADRYECKYDLGYFFGETPGVSPVMGIWASIIYALSGAFSIGSFMAVVYSLIVLRRGPRVLKSYTCFVASMLSLLLCCYLLLFFINFTHGGIYF